MGAMLHIQGPRVIRNASLRRFASCRRAVLHIRLWPRDMARLLMHTKGRELIEAGLQAVHRFAQGMAEMEWFYLAPSRFRLGPRREHWSLSMYWIRVGIRGNSGFSASSRDCERSRICTGSGIRARIGIGSIRCSARERAGSPGFTGNHIAYPFKQTVQDLTGTYTGYDYSICLSSTGAWSRSQILTVCCLYSARFPRWNTVSGA